MQTCAVLVPFARVMEFTGNICEVTPFLESYEPINEILVAWCGTVWMSPHTGKEYLLMCHQMLRFGTTLPHSLLNLNQIRAYGIDVNDNPFDPVSDFGIQSNEAFIPFDTTGTVVHFETRAPMEDECHLLPVILLMAEEWDPRDELLYPHNPSGFLKSLYNDFLAY